MHTKGCLLFPLSVLTATAALPIESDVEHLASSTFKINVWNNCPSTKQFALYQVTANFKMLERSETTCIPSRKIQTIVAPYKDLGMRLSGHAEWGTTGQWKTQALFEFGYSEYAGRDGTAYDLSVMEGSDDDIGIKVSPVPNDRGSKQCPSKTCFPWDCPMDQGWTNPQQSEHGSLGDTVCYFGKTDFDVVFCP